MRGRAEQFRDYGYDMDYFKFIIYIYCFILSKRVCYISQM